jgi:hypothetical protein
LSNSLSPKIAEDGAVISHVASTPFRLDAQYCSLFKIVAARLKGQWESHRNAPHRSNDHIAPPVLNLVSDSAFLVGVDGTLKPYDSLDRLVPSHDRSQLEASTVGDDTSRRRRSRLQPGLSHSAFDDVPLNPFALRTGKRSQVLARCARLNRRQTHWRAAIGAFGAFVLCVEHARP